MLSYFVSPNPPQLPRSPALALQHQRIFFVLEQLFISNKNKENLDKYDCFSSFFYVCMNQIGLSLIPVFCVLIVVYYENYRNEPDRHWDSEDNIWPEYRNNQEPEPPCDHL